MLLELLVLVCFFYYLFLLAVFVKHQNTKGSFLCESLLGNKPDSELF